MLHVTIIEFPMLYPPPSSPPPAPNYRFIEFVSLWHGIADSDNDSDNEEKIK